MESHRQTDLPGSKHDTTYRTEERELYDSDPFVTSRDSSMLPQEMSSNSLPHPIPSPEYHSSSSSHRSGEFADDDDFGYGRRDGASSRSSISSLPGSVVVYPPDKMRGYPFLPHHDDPNMTISAARTNKAKSPKYASKVRDRSSPFRHPSSVVAMQMGDEEAMESDYSTLSSRKVWRKEKASVQSPSFSDRSAVSQGSIKASSYPHHRQRSSPRATAHHAQQQPQQVQKEFPLILLHCTLLSPSLSLPQGLDKPSPQLLEEVLPPKYWQRWKSLGDKIVGSGIIRDRGVLISHPQEAYDLLEERLLESLELVKPRLADGHFLGGDETEEEREQQSHDDNDTGSGHEDESEHRCPDCGGSVNPNDKKWDVRVYAANGLMRAGAWAVAWREMEKVDVEVSVRLPPEVRRELETRIAEEERVKVEAERQLTDEEERLREIYGDPTSPSQEDIDGLVAEENCDTPYTPERRTDSMKSHSHDVRPSTEEFQENGVRRDVDLRTALWNYLRILSNDPRNVFLFFLSILVVHLAANMGTTTTSEATLQGKQPLNTPLAQTLESYATTETESLTTPSATVIPYEGTVSSHAAPEASEFAASSLSGLADNGPDHDSDDNEDQEVPEVPAPDVSKRPSSDDTGSEPSSYMSEQAPEQSQSAETSDVPTSQAFEIPPNGEENTEEVEGTVEGTDPKDVPNASEPSQQHPPLVSEA